MIRAIDPPAYAAMTWTSISGIAVASAAVLAMDVAVLKTGRSPLTLLQRAALRIQGECLWLRKYAWPAVKRERHQIKWCISECHLRVVEAVPPAHTEPVAQREPATGSARSGRWDMEVRGYEEL